MLFEELRAFVAFVSNGSISRAATQLQLTQPAITRRIQRLEATIGGALLDRSAKPPRPSPLGQRFYVRARTLLQEVDGLRSFISEDGEPEGALRIGAAQSISSATGLRAVTALKRRFPKLRIEMRADWSLELIEKVRLGRLDAAAVMLPLSAQLPDGVVAERIGTHRAVVVTTRTFPLKGDVPLRRLADHPWVIFPEGGCICRAALEREFRARGLNLDVSVADFGVEQQLALVAAGAGLGFVPEVMLKASRHRSSLRMIAVKDFEFKFVIWLVRSPFLGRLTAAVDSLGDVVRECFGDETKSRLASERRSARKKNG